MVADNPVAVVQPAPSDTQPDVIEIIGTRSQQSQKIDRRTYRVQDNPHSAQKDSLQLLRGLPAVTITSNDDVQLLGSSGVTILVDGGPVHGDARLYLKTLHGSDIERIEIITNPSAQYPSQGTGGIINFVLRKKEEDGVSASTSIEGSSFGAVTSVNSIRVKKGKWTYEGQAQGWHGGDFRQHFESLRSYELTPGATPTINTQEGRSTYRFDSWSASASATYAFDDRTSLGANMFLGGYDTISNTRTVWEGLTPDFPSFVEQQRAEEGMNYRGAEFSFNHQGKKEGATLQIFGSIYGDPSQYRRVRGIWSDGTPYSIDVSNHKTGSWVKVDWNHPVGKRGLLSVGTEWTFQHRYHDYRFDRGPSAAGIVDRFEVEDGNGAAWATFQQHFGSWTVMPGVRIERLARDLSQPGSPSIHVDRTNLFPTFHLQKPLTKTLDLTASYSKRISRPDDDYLRPYSTITGALAVSGGNPYLRDQRTDAFELNLHYHRKSIDAGIILYDRETDQLWSAIYGVGADGSNLMNWTNAGKQSDRGAQIDLSTPLLARIKGTASVNLFASRVPIDGAAGPSTFESFRYTGNATIEWDGPDRKGKSGDVGQLQLQYESRSRAFEYRSAATYSLNASWTHSLTRSLSFTATINHIGPNQYRYWVSTPLLQSHTFNHLPGPEYRFKLVKTFGGGKAPPPSSPPPVPVPR